MKINMNEWKDTVLSSENRIAIPIMTHSGIELIGHTVKEAVTNGEIHYQAIMALAEKYPSSASSVIMDLTVEAEAFGADIVFTDHEVPTVVGRLVSNAEEIEALKVPSLLSGRIPEYLKANKLVAAHSDRPVFSGCIGPYSLAGRLFDMSEIMMAIYIEPDNIKKLLDKCTQFIEEYCLALKETGVNGVLIAEPAAGLLSDEACSEFSSAYVRRIVEKVQDESFFVILHNCGNMGQCTGAMLETGAAGLHFGNTIDMVETLQRCPSDVLVMGNIDPVGVFKMDTSEDLYNKVTGLLQTTAGYRNFILSSGCDTPPRVPFENIDMFYKALQDYNTK